MAPKRDKPLCPRCGQPISYYKRKKVGNRVYVYAVHYVKVGGKSRKKECYLGPEDEYEYVSRMHMREGLMLKGMADKKRAVEYLETLIQNITETAEQLEAHELRRLEQMLTQAQQQIHTILQEKQVEEGGLMERELG